MPHSLMISFSSSRHSYSSMVSISMSPPSPSGSSSESLLLIVFERSQSMCNQTTVKGKLVSSQAALLYTPLAHSTTVEMKMAAKTKFENTSAAAVSSQTELVHASK
uniref:(northern house mosquito) hypothetical protein n=1 Tax=Culex pipiens TaxID=7175 RepID=A0A8D8JQU5_CULPI